MTIQWGAWASAGGNAARVGVDFGYADNQITPYIYIQRQVAGNSDNIYLTISGTFENVTTGFSPFSGAANEMVMWRTSGPFTQARNTTATYNVTVHDFNWGGVPSVAATCFLPPLAPNAPTSAVDTTINDTQVDVSWVNHSTVDRPVFGNNIYRIDNVAGTSMVASVAAGATSFSDTGLAANRKFAHRIDAANSGGNASATTNYVYTTPAAPATVAAAKSGSGDIQVTFDATTTTYYADCNVNIEESTNNGSTWSSLVTVSAVSGSWVHTAPPTGVSHRYRVRVVAPNSLTSLWTESNTVQLLARPNAPTNLSMLGSIQSTSSPAADATGTITVSWQHNPVDSSAQSAYEIAYQTSTDGGSTWAAEVLSGKISSSTQARTYAANTFPNNRTIRWRVRTWGVYAGMAPTYSDWSAYSTYYTNARPVASLTGSGTWTTSSLTATGGYLDPEGSAQTGARWTLKDSGGNVLEDDTFGSSELSGMTSNTFSTRVHDGSSYTVVYSVRDSAGFWSAPVTQTISVVYSKPNQPSLTVLWSDEVGRVSGQITNPPGGVAAVYNVVYRDGVPLMALSGVAPNGSFVDPIPPLGKAVMYSVVAVSALPSSSNSATAMVTTKSNRAWINGGTGMSLAVSLLYAPTLDGDQTRERKWVGYDSRPDEVLYVGMRRARQYKLTGLMTAEELAVLLALEDTPQVMCYRDPSGRKDFVGIQGGISYKDGSTERNVKHVSFSMRACGYSE